MKLSTRKEMMERLGFFLGDWAVEITHPHLQPDPIRGVSRFDWLEGTYLIQRTQIDKTEFPNYTSIYDWDPETGHYVYHYFDSRGVTRLYQMTFEEGAWTLWRDKADFTPLAFFQRFIGTIDDAGNRIEVVLEKSDDGVSWEHDFKLVYIRSGETG